MICWRCQTSNPEPAVYCAKCGYPLTRRPGAPRAKNPWLIVAAAGLVLLGVAAVLFVILSKRPPAGTPGAAEVPAAKAVASEASVPFLPGEVVVRDAAGLEVARFAAPAVGAGWVATPLWALFRGAEIRHQGGDRSETLLERAFWNEGDPVVLWKSADTGAAETSGFGPWRRNDILLWRALSAEASPLRIEVANPRPRGLYLSFALPAEVRRAGCLFQKDRVVGWTFGEEPERGYLWAGPEESDLVPNLGVDQVFGSVVAEGREVGFSRAMALGSETDPAERLSAFARGFQLAPYLGDEDLPFGLRTPSVISQMQALATTLTRDGRPGDVVRILEENILTEAADPELVKAAVVARARDQDYNRAIQYLDRLKKSVFEAQGRSSSGLEPFRAQLYKDWLREILDKGGYFSAQVAYDEAARAFPDDPEIRLLGVEVALAENNLARARELLQEREVPPLLKARADHLAARLKASEEEEALVVPFNPGEKRIYLEAKVNGTYRMRFLVDTGATISSIPPEAAEALGLEPDRTAPVRAVTTASGVMLAYQVFLSSIDVTGYRVENLKVIVLDMPSEYPTGILGMDFLNNFRYEIDNKAAVFRLKKK